MAKTNLKGRSTYEAYIKLHRGVTDSPAWKELSCEAKCLMLSIWERHNGTNNGRIPFSHREARLALSVGNTKTARAFKQAQEHGFLIARKKGSFNYKVSAGEGRATEWEISTEPCDGALAKQGFKNWKKQNAVPEIGNTGSQGGSRSAKTIAQNSPDGSQGGSRYVDFRVVSGS
tara:strand:- start:210 stop:731 length:522 start_codon:yes stop_codon:yes gene_type:complete